MTAGDFQDRRTNDDPGSVDRERRASRKGRLTTFCAKYRHIVRCSAPEILVVQLREDINALTLGLERPPVFYLGGTVNTLRIAGLALRAIAFGVAVPFRLVGIVLSVFGLASGSPWAAVLSSSSRRRFRRW